MIEYRKERGVETKYSKAQVKKKNDIKAAKSRNNTREVEALEATPTGLFYEYDDREEKKSKKGAIPYKITKGERRTFEELSWPACPV